MDPLIPFLRTRESVDNESVLKGGEMKTNGYWVRWGFVCILHRWPVFVATNLKGQDKDRSPALPTKEVYTGTVAAIGGQFAGASRPFTLEITGYTSSDEPSASLRFSERKGRTISSRQFHTKSLGSFSHRRPGGPRLEICTGKPDREGSENHDPV